MRRALGFLVLIAVVVGVAVWLAEHPGTITIHWLDRVIETSVGFAVFVLAALLVLAAQGYRLYRGTVALPGLVRSWWRHRRFARGFRALNRGFASLAAGDVQDARKEANRAEKLLRDPSVTLVLSAQAAQAAGDEAKARGYFERMLEREDSAILGVRGLLRDALARGDDEDALRLARRARQLRPTAPWALKTLLDLEVRAHKYADAQETLDQAAKANVFDPQEARRKKVALLIARSRAAEQGEQDQEEALRHAKRALELMPDSAPAAVRLARLHLDRGQKRAAAKTLEKVWGQAPHPDIAALYGRLDGDEPEKIFKRMERLVDQKPNNDVGRLAMGEAALTAGHYAEARTLLRRVAEHSPAPKVYRLLSELEIAETGDAAAARDWLARGAEAPPDPAWVCMRTGAVFSEWVPVTPQGDLGTLVWTATSPARLAPGASGGYVMESGDVQLLGEPGASARASA